MLLVLGALGSVGILALIVISFKQQSKLANLGGKLANLGVTISYLDKHVARSQATDDILRALKSLDDRIEPKAGTRTPKEIESESFGDGEIPKSWQTPAIATSADSPRGSSRQTELPLDAYCQGSMTLESLTEQATRQGVRWGSFVTRGGQFEFNEGTSANKLIGFRRTKASEFWLVLGEGTIWNPDFTLFFELKDEREPLVGERILTTKPAIARFDHGTPLDVIKGVMRTP
ncbi:MAG: hypothetical protein A3I61_17250 [Acidobacteria bacterium RIFCSPLOWO2_02_FULL_68_18]|nr:MAG: hypothetical protein A3I61_17250 [Acidobacteria bacterium RIFCSPLOWO2_02_FULL_68_18]OFW50426.1 MAG: hypothetical protein A3G77_11825 [Acidobacteria bacterium RIFCSPLOWO2_12_FULL_68_19]